MEKSKAIRLSAAIFMFTMAILMLVTGSALPNYGIFAGIAVYVYGMLTDPGNEEDESTKVKD